MRYQHSPWYVKLYRWLRYRPWYALCGRLSVIAWRWNGSIIPYEESEFFKTKTAYVEHILTCWRSYADYKMQHVYSLREMINALKEPD